jgi:hypothetical protein
MRRYRARKRLGRSPIPTTVASRHNAGREGNRVYSDHRILDARSLALHCAIVRKIEKNPHLLDIARRNVAAAEARQGSAIGRPWREWKAILRRPWAEIANAMTELSERSTALRQSSPFAGILDSTERKRIYDAFRA